MAVLPRSDVGRLESCGSFFAHSQGQSNHVALPFWMSLLRRSDLCHLSKRCQNLQHFRMCRSLTEWSTFVLCCGTNQTVQRCIERLKPQGRSVEPCTFKRVRTEVLRAEMLVRQFLASKSKAASGANDVPPFLDVDAVPFHRLGSVMSVLHDTVASYDATDKLKVELTNTSESRRRSFSSVIFAPFRGFAGDHAFSLHWDHESWWLVLEFQFCVSSELAVLHITCRQSAKILLQIAPRS